MEISHEEFNTIMKQKDIYEKMKENVKNISEETFQFLVFQETKQYEFKDKKNNKVGNNLLNR